MKKVECCYNCEKYSNDCCYPTEYDYDRFEVEPDDYCNYYKQNIPDFHFLED